MDCSVFIYLWGIYSAGSACVLLTIIVRVAHRYGQLYLALLINILLGSFQLFLHSDHFPWGWNNPGSAVSASRGGCIIHAGGGFTQPTDRLLDAQTDDDQRQTSSRRASFSALASANPSYFASSAATSRWRICMLHRCVCQLLLLAFLSRWACRYAGVITVMINSPLTVRWRWCG